MWLGSLLPDEVVQGHAELLFYGVCHAVVGCWTGSLEGGEEMNEVGVGCCCFAAERVLMHSQDQTYDVFKPKIEQTLD